MRETVVVDLVLFNNEQLVGNAEMLRTRGGNDLDVFDYTGLLKGGVQSKASSMPWTLEI